MTLDDLIDIEAIKRVKYKYLRCLDQKLWEEMAEVFTDDAVAAYSGGKYSFDGSRGDHRLPGAVDGRRDVPLESSGTPSRRST